MAKRRAVQTKVQAARAQGGFRVAARTLLHLGRELITSDEIALNELVKNSFDAGSLEVKILVACPVPKPALDKLTQRIRDLSPSALQKQRAVLAEELRGLASRPLKGRVAEHVQETASRLSRVASVDDAVALLEDVNFIEVEDSGSGINRKDILPVFLTVGTDFKLKNKPLEGADEYLGNKGIGRLAMMRLGDRAEVVTWSDPTGASRVLFDWRKFDRADKQLSEIKVPVTRTRPPREAESGTVIRISGLRSDWVPGDNLAERLQQYFRRLRDPFSTRKRFPIRVSINGNTSLPFKPMREDVRQDADQEVSLAFDPAEPSQALRITNVDPKAKTEDTEVRSLGEIAAKCMADSADIASIGPFTLRLLRFNRTLLRKRRQGEWPATRKELDAWTGGIAIYRDGFRVGFSGSHEGEDWLGLDRQALRGSGYTVNRIQVVGALEITHKGNPQLIDLTNREGLISTPQAEYLKLILLECAIKPLKGFVEAQDEKLSRQRFEQLINEGTPTIQNRMVLAREEVARLAEAVPPSLKEPVQSIETHLHFISTKLQSFESALDKVSEGREDILELASVGNVMQGVMHELTRTTSQTRHLISQLAQTADASMKDLLEKLESEIRAINVRLRQLDPLTPSGRHVKKDVEVDKLARTILSGYSIRFARHHIEHEVKVLGTSPVKVRMVPGFLSLVLENLVSNSVYWLAQSPPADEPGRIDIEIDAKAGVITFSDNGPGIAAADRERVFAPGWSLRPRGKGYGMYLAQEVAEFHGCRLYLENASDDDGRIRTFVLELPRGG